MSIVAVSLQTSTKGASANLAPDGAPILGASSALLGGIDFPLVNQGSLNELNDGVVVSDPSLLNVQGAFFIDADGSAGQNGNGVDTFAGGATNHQFDYVGVLFPEAVYGVTSVRVQHYLANDGGWWGPYSGPPTSAPLSPSDLKSPQVQVTTNGGASWSNISVTSSDYVAQYTGVPRGTGFPNATAGPLATLAFPAQDGINGIRLIENGAGNVDAGPGFIGVTELEVIGTRQALRLIVNTSNGVVSIANSVQTDIAFDFYRITSPSGSLNVSGWNSFQDPADNEVGFPSGDGSGNGWEELGTPSTAAVAEAYLSGASTIANGESPVTLGTLFAAGGQEDLTFRYRTASGRFVDVTDIQYVSEPSLMGDFNADGMVDAADYVVWRRNMGTNTPMYNDATPGAVDQDDYENWRANFGQSASHARLFSTAAPLLVPEPGSVALLLSQACGFVSMVRTRSGYPWSDDSTTGRWV